ncbi:unnamed protein product [Durusdinium trenchii]|uniref:Uncharacterized protein n=1 Tax=Durusdinium trenchii TaxID=1381693 RepID=A0ABP0MT75_9DINO
MRLSLICIVDGVRSTFAASNSSTSCHVVFLLDMETASFLQWCSWLHQRLQTLLRWPQIPEIRRLNAGYVQKQRAEELQQIHAALRVLAPMDLWLYQYISRDFSIRLKALEADEDSCAQGISPQPQVIFPSEKQLGGCTSSRERIACGAEVFEGG